MKKRRGRVVVWLPLNRQNTNKQNVTDISWLELHQRKGLLMLFISLSVFDQPPFLFVLVPVCIYILIYLFNLSIEKELIRPQSLVGKVLFRDTLRDLEDILQHLSQQNEKVARRKNKGVGCVLGGGVESVSSSICTTSASRRTDVSCRASGPFTEETTCRQREGRIGWGLTAAEPWLAGGWRGWCV